MSSARQAAVSPVKQAAPAKSSSAPKPRRKSGMAVVGEADEAAETAAPAAALPAPVAIDPETEPPASELVEEEEEDEVEVVAEEDNSGPSTDLVRAYLKEIGRVALLNAEQEVNLAKRIEAGLFAAERLRQAEAGELKITKALAQGLRSG